MNLQTDRYIDPTPTMFGLDIVPKRYILVYSTQFLLKIRLAPRNAVVVATNVYGKSHYQSRYTELRDSMNFSPF